MLGYAIQSVRKVLLCFVIGKINNWLSVHVFDMIFQISKFFFLGYDAIPLSHFMVHLFSVVTCKAVTLILLN